MTKYQLANPSGGPLDYPALGFSAVNGAILDGSLSTPAITSAPGPQWSVYSGGSAETGITRYAPSATLPTYTEPQDGYVLRYSDLDNGYIPQSLEDAVGPAVESLREQANGVAGLDSSGKLYDSRTPDRLSPTTLSQTSTNRWSGAAPSLGVRSDTFFLSASADGNVETQLNAFLADSNLRGKKRLVGYAKIANPVTVPAGTWLDGSEAVIEQTTTGKTSLNVTGNGVHINGLRMIGPNVSAVYRASEHAIRAVGASAASPIRGLRLEDVTIDRFGFYGIQAQHVYDLEVLGCDIYGIGYTGVMLLSVIGFNIEGGTIDGAIGNGSNSYGIAMTRAEANSLTDHPRTQDGSVRGVTVRNIPWEGIDSHAGKGITVANNRVTGCLVGIAMVGCEDETGPRYAPLDFAISDNTIDSYRIDGGAQAGITVAGAQGATANDPAVQYATGTVTGNVIRGHGSQTNANLGAMYLRNTRGLSITGNTFAQPSPSAITLFYDNRGAVIVGNTVQDAWSNTVTTPSAVASRSANNTGCVAANSLLTTSAPAGAVYKNVYGFRSDGTGGDWGTNSVMVANNFFTAAATPVSGIA